MAYSKKKDDSNIEGLQEKLVQVNRVAKTTAGSKPHASGSGTTTAMGLGIGGLKT